MWRLGGSVVGRGGSRSLLLGALLAGGFCQAVGWSGERVQSEVRLLESVTVASERVAASDLLAVEASSTLVKLLSRVDLGYAALPGYKKTIDRSALLRILAPIVDANGWSIPERITIERKSRILGDDEIRAAAGAFVVTLGSPAVKVNAESISCPRSIYVPDEPIRLEFSPPRRALLGRRLDLLMAIRTPTGLFRKQWVQATIGYTATVPVAGRDISAFEKLAAADFSMEERKLESVVEKLLDPSFTPAGSVTRRAIRAGEVISPLYLSPPLLVKQGDRVRIIVRNESFQIQAEGVARAAGRLGDTILILNTESKKILTGRVTGEREVEVES